MTNFPYFQFDDGGRKSAGYKGTTGDCGVRSMAIVTGRPYREIYDGLYEMCRSWPGNSRKAKAIRANASPRTGLNVGVMQRYMEGLGWQMVMFKRRLDDPALPRERVLCVVRKHYFALVDNVVRDTFDDRMARRVVTADGEVIRPKPRVVYRYFIEKGSADGPVGLAS